MMQISTDNFLSMITLIGAVAFTLTALISWFQPGMRPTLVKRISIASAAISIPIAILGGFFVFAYGPLQSSTIGYTGLGLSLRLDSVSMIILTMIALLGFIVVKFSLNYLDGDARQGAFLGRIAAAIASVQLLVLAGNLGLILAAWVLTSISLHRLLLFYPDRPGAIIVARKKFIVARLSDACLALAVVMLYQQFGTGDLTIIFEAIKQNAIAGSPFMGIETAAIFIALAAVFKSALFPTHGWLVEVMETPTPVSALLHAGLLNAGPFLIMRLAFIMEVSSYATYILVIMGAFTALFASVVYLTQTSIKTALSYSSIAHMGFSLMMCGLGLYPAAILHLVAHSFYKAHSFLSSGSVIDLIKIARLGAPVRIGSPLRILVAIALSIGVFIGGSMVVGVDPKGEFSLLIIGTILTLGISRIFVNALDSKANLKLIGQALLMVMGVSTAFFLLETGAHYLVATAVPATMPSSLFEIVLISIIFFAFLATVIVQMLAPFITKKPAHIALAIHLKNGLYANAIFDRIIGSWSNQVSPTPLIENQTTELETFPQTAQA